MLLYVWSVLGVYTINTLPSQKNVSKDACFAVPGSGTGYFTIHNMF